MASTIRRDNMIELVLRNLVRLAIDSISFNGSVALVIGREVVLVGRFDKHSCFVCEFVLSFFYECDV
jgi:hypothetical protein